MMPARVLQAPPPPLSSKGRANGISASKSSSSSLLAASPSKASSEYDVDMRLTPVANGSLPLIDTDETAEGHSLIDDESDDEYDSESDDLLDAPVVHVEVRQKDNSAVVGSVIADNVRVTLQEAYASSSLPIGEEIPEEVWGDISFLARTVDRVFLPASDDITSSVDGRTANFEVHVYRVSDYDDEVKGGFDDDEEDSRTAAAKIHALPGADLEGLWENLIYDSDVKPRLLRYISSAMLFSESEIDMNVISWNRLVLLHGPPGTGKTSLCRALAHKLAVRLSDTYEYGRLVEINSHSLFSKWFSESGKLVQKLFDTINEMAADEGCFVVVMIDEVESLTAARAGAMSGSEPSDALRVVNALLTQLDKLKRHNNVLVLTTSNLAGSIDPAFVDRADIKEYIGLPPPQAIYWILSSCLSELSRSGLATGSERLLTWDELSKTGEQPREKKRDERARQASVRLAALARTCRDLELSGRFLRKVPLVAHARYLARSRTCGAARMEKWVEALERAVQDERGAREKIDSAEGKRASAPK